MIEEIATIVEMDHDNAWVETVQKSACGSCSVNKACGTSVLASVLGKKTNRIRVVNSLNAAVGDQVVIGMHETALLRGAILVYILPLLTLIGFALLAEVLAQQLAFELKEPFVILSAIVGLLSGLLWVRIYSSRFVNDPRFQAVMLAKSKIISSV
ncbi:MAG: SoxR reducing system RseC family protein [Gammaproteobacteria bacterium]|nr:SoxR reducing system RseC family protein [Gammaproteobacteria bacterium]MDH5778312.1 SoxR reducing system RseC family protein [Gammaproteobacteria bacterium]